MPREKQFNEQEAINRFTEVFWQKGYNACSVGDLLAASGLSRSSMYDTFGDKEQLFIRCLQNYSEHLKKGLEAATQNKETAIEKIEAAMLMPFNVQSENSNCKGCLAVNTMSELNGTTDEIQQLILNTKEGFETFLTTCIEQGQEQGAVTNAHKPTDLAALLYTNLCGLLILQKTTLSSADLSLQVTILLDLLKQ